MDVPRFIAALGFMIPMYFTPGPNNVLCAVHGSQHGIRATIPLICGMAVGWLAMGVLVAGALDVIERNREALLYLTWVGAGYIAYLSYKIITSKPLDEEEAESQVLGPATGFTLQFVNGKAWIHDLVLLGSFGTIFGSGFLPMVALVVLAIFLTVPAILCWTAFGTLLRKAFSTPESAVVLNRVMGASLLAVAIWLVAFH